MQRKQVLFCSAVIGSVLALGGCASKTTTADLMRAHASEARAEADLKSELAKDWEKGSNLFSSGKKRLKSGEKRVESAERDLKTGRQDIERGSQEIARGQELMRQSESRFREAFPGSTIQPDK